MSAPDPSPFPPGAASFVPERDDPSFDRDNPNHMDGWNRAVVQALKNFGRAPGQYHAGVVLSARVDVTNPGNVVEYIAKFI